MKREKKMKCKICGKTYPEYMFTKGICINCYQSVVDYKPSSNADFHKKKQKRKSNITRKE